MQVAIAVLVLGILAVVVSTTFASRIGVAAPLIVTIIGIGVGFLPFVSAIEFDPHWLLGALLPLLLYSVAVNTPVMEFRRDFGVISIFSVVLVVVSAIVVGFVLTWVMPGLPLALGIAVGAIISPTDAVATSIVRKVGVSPRIVTVLEGEAMLNDASALVLLRTAVAAIAVSVTAGQVVEDFAWAVAAAIVIGLLIGRVNLAVRSHITPVTASVAFSLIVPFLAYFPAEYVHASGLVAAVTAGIVSGQGMPRRLDAQVRIAERTVWQTVELLAESAVFLMMGLQLFGLVEDVVYQGGNLWAVLGIGALAATLILVIRTIFVTGSVWSLSKQYKRRVALDEAMRNHRLSLREQRRMRELRERTRSLHPDQVNRFHDMVVRRRANLDYLVDERFGWREGVVLVWAGMRGAVTLAAAQSLPSSTPNRAFLVLVAFTVAAGTLLVQGATLAPLVRKLGLTREDDTADASKLDSLLVDLATVVDHRLDDPLLVRENGRPYSADVLDRVRRRQQAAANLREDETADATAQLAEAAELRLDIIECQRAELLRLRGVGSYPSAVLNRALAMLDVDQIVIEMRDRS